MLKNIIGFISGLLFGLGLLLSGMTNPTKVIGFLDITGAWDISLALVMGGALIISSIGFYIAKSKVAKGEKSLTGDIISIPTKTAITPQLIIGAVLFGIGWGLTGICPGPGIVMAGLFPLTGAWQGVIFTLALLVGMFGYELTQKSEHI